MTESPNISMSPFQLLRSLVFLVFVPIVTTTVCLLAIIDTGLLKRAPAKVQIYPRLWAIFLTRIAGVHIRVTGMNNIDKQATYVFAGNHTSQLDIYSFQARFPHDFRWIAKKELFNIPIFGLAMRRVGFISIDRSHGRKALKSLNQAAERIGAGSSVLIFPEGTRSKNGRLHPFKSGAILLAIKSGVPIVPVGFNNVSRILPKGKLLPRGGEVEIRIGRPIPTADYTAKDKQILASMLHDRVAELLDPMHLPDNGNPD
jgi:1-acyl-sn-glycerol-3-phosphate acyltransferase